MASRRGLEPLTPGLGNLCSILLSYRDSQSTPQPPKRSGQGRPPRGKALSMNFRSAHRRRAWARRSRAAATLCRLRRAAGHGDGGARLCGLRPPGRAGPAGQRRSAPRYCAERRQDRPARRPGRAQCGSRGAGNRQRCARFPQPAPARPGSGPHPPGRADRSVGQDDRRPQPARFGRRIGGFDRGGAAGGGLGPRPAGVRDPRLRRRAARDRGRRAPARPWEYGATPISPSSSRPIRPNCGAATAGSSSSRGWCAGLALRARAFILSLFRTTVRRS